MHTPSTATRHWRASPSRAGHLPLLSAVEGEKDHEHELKEVGGPKCEAVTQRNSARKDMFVRVSFVETAGSPMQDLHSFSLIYVDLNDQL